jgi:hypothetical protein
MPPSEATTSPQRVRVSLLLDEVFEERVWFPCVVLVWSPGKVKMPRRINGSIAEVLELRFVVFNLYFQLYEFQALATLPSTHHDSQSLCVIPYRSVWAFGKRPGFGRLLSSTS